MSYLTNEAFQEIYNNVKICSMNNGDGVIYLRDNGDEINSP